MTPLRKLSEHDTKRLSEILEAELERLVRRGDVVGLSQEDSSMLFVLAWGLICFGVFKIFGPVALLIFIAITIGALVVTTIRARHKWQGRQ